MPSRWTFFAFDWSRFRALEPALQRASETGDFTGEEFTEAESLFASLEEDTPPERVAVILAAEMCGEGEPVVFEAGLTERVRRMRREPGGEEAAELLGTLMTAAPNMPAWCPPDDLLQGLLTPEETQALATAFADFRRHCRPTEPPRGLEALKRRFTLSEPAQERLEDLMRLVEAASAQRLGLALERLE